MDLLPSFLQREPILLDELDIRYDDRLQLTLAHQDEALLYVGEHPDLCLDLFGVDVLTIPP